jgi:hypothetical protein
MLAMGLNAQTPELIVKDSNKGLYFDHKVTAKENFYSIGRLFNVHPKYIASFNSLDMSKGLALGQMIRIPLTDTNFNQRTENGQPVYYVTGSGENLRRVSTSHNNVLIENLREWNNLFTDNISNGSRLIVGFLVTKETPATTGANPKKSEAVTNPTQEVNKDVAKTEKTSPPEAKKDLFKDEEMKKEQLTKEEPKKVEPARDEPKKEEPKKENELQKEESKKEVVQLKEVKPQSSNQGYFKTSFDQQVKQHPVTKEQTLTSGIFKTASGWSDAKYYLLMNGVEPGTIVKIINPENNKMIYAKLLGEISGLNQNKGVNIRISNAAASALDIAETEKFIVKLNY